jgi:hypothetical protein
MYEFFLRFRGADRLAIFKSPAYHINRQLRRRAISSRHLSFCSLLPLEPDVEKCPRRPPKLIENSYWDQSRRPGFQDLERADRFQLFVVAFGGFESSASTSLLTRPPWRSFGHPV